MTGKTFQEVLSEVEGKKILVVNRGISARRVLRSIRERLRGIPVLTVTDVDMTSPAVAGAHELIQLGPNPRAYLDLDMVIKKAKAQGVVAIHPGWGFASEDDAFPDKCEKAGILFIGSTSEAMLRLGNKVEVRRLAMEIGIPVVPGSEGAVSIPEAREIAKEIGFPIMLKAEGGGGGRGIYEVYKESELEAAFSKASAQAQASFGNPRLFVEKLLTSVRHIEIQVAADKFGNVFAFDERDCSVQRNHQKLVEITPSPWKGMTPELRETLKEYSEKLVKASKYHSLATVEFLVDHSGRPYLIEVNTRLQVEHGITECRYGVDLVEEQISIAFGGKLRFSKKNAKPLLHAMQVRINCEDPIHGFEPNSGVVTRYISPGGQGVRLDSNLSSGYDFPPQYDSAGALLISYGKDFEKVCAIMNRALFEYIVGGIKTTIPFQRQIINNKRFREGEFDTRFVANTPELLNYRDEEPEALRLSRLVGEIAARGYNPYVQLGEYRGRQDRRVGRFAPYLPALEVQKNDSPYPRGDRKALLDMIRDSKKVHFVDTTARDSTQSNSGNRFRLAEDALIGPYLDNCGFFALENGGGAHYHVAMLANMTHPFSEAAEWNRFAPKTLKQLLIRSTNILGYKPQPKNIMRLTGEMICEHYDVIRCFDFLNHAENMRPFAEVAMNSKGNIFEPAISLSWAPGFDIPHYLEVLEEILGLCQRASGAKSRKAASKMIILALKDMGGNCPPRFIRELVAAIRKAYPDLALDYHRHYTDGLFVPAVGAAAEAGVHIVDTAIGASVRWYGQGEVLSTASYIQEDLGVPVMLTEDNKDMIRACNFALKQIMPYYDRYAAPYFRGIDHDVIHHAMPGGATSSSQEGALKQGYIHLLPYMLKFLAGTRRIVRYHDVTPGSQITWNTAFLAVTGAYKEGGEVAVRDLLEVLEDVAGKPEEELTRAAKADRLKLYADCNDAFRDLLLGKFGRMPLGFPPDWVYESAFGPDYRKAIESRTTASPLTTLADADIEAEREALRVHLERAPTEEEFVNYLNHPGDALKTITFQREFGDPNRLPLDVWFEGLEPGQDTSFNDSNGMPHSMTILDISAPDARGVSIVRYSLDSEPLSHQVQVAENRSVETGSLEMADPNDPYQVASPCNGDLWVTQVGVGDPVKAGEELFNISVMKQEKAVLAPIDGIVKRVVKTADFVVDKKMVPIKEGELIVELAPLTGVCAGCGEPAAAEGYHYCPHCGKKMS